MSFFALKIYSHKATLSNSAGFRVKNSKTAFFLRHPVYDTLINWSHQTYFLDLRLLLPAELFSCRLQHIRAGTVDLHLNISIDFHLNISVDLHLNVSVDLHLNISVDLNLNISVDLYYPVQSLLPSTILYSRVGHTLRLHQKTMALKGVLASMAC